MSTDLVQRDSGTGGVDFLRETSARAKHIITNPPYGRGLADAFVKQALALTASTGGKVAMLLKPGVTRAPDAPRALDLTPARPRACAR